MLARSRLARVRYPGRPLPHGRVRRHATVLFTDIEGSTAHLVRIGDDAWTHLQDAHDRIAARLVKRHDGRLITTTGDGMLALFWDASGALRCARRFTAEAAELGISVRSGMHSGTCLLAGRNVSGLTVHIAARVASLAQGGEVRVSQATRELLDGAPDELTDCGPHRLKGVPGEWRLFAVTAASRCAPGLTHGHAHPESDRGSDLVREQVLEPVEHRAVG